MQAWHTEASREARNQQDAPSSIRELIEKRDNDVRPSAIPVALCGKTEQVGRGVIEGLKPEYEGEPLYPSKHHTPPGEKHPPFPPRLHEIRLSANMTRVSAARKVVHFITTPVSGAVILPALLSNQPPPSHPDSSAIGSGNYATPPRAVILGGAFDDATTEVLRKAVAETQGAREVPWLSQDSSKPAPPLGPEYGKAMVARVKEALTRLEGEGKLDGSYGGAEWY
ncbi:hypothetical protein CCHL11_03602 [Colletotrichum chlorophyti]|uniref:Uncharacterized protein n=1 Tax=Colletotrichum chlorophyti TaxID=708187 RepID=A0A1Q8RST1_9PEZI|nr:hypothetical protein CCHL11_03602 [Colletotrichum chlorophyti]